MMNEFNNVFNNSDRNNIFFPDDDIFTLYLNSEDNVRNINGGNYMSDIKVNNTNNGFGHHYNPDNIFNPADQEANKVNHDISKGSFKTPEVSNAKINIDCKEKLSAWSTYSKNQVFSNSFTNSINNAQVQQHQQQPNKMCNINGYGQPIINHNLVSQNTVSGLFTNPAGAFTSTSGNNLYNNFNKPFPTSSHSVNKLIDLVGSKQQLPIDLKLEQSSTKNTSFESKTYKQNNNSTSSLTKYKINSKSCSSLSEKDLIFKTTKVKRQIMDYDDSDKSDEFEEGLDPMQLKLQKNRVAAKKSRQKRKIYIQNLEERVKYLETELDNQKKLYEKQNKLNDLVKLMNQKNEELSDMLYSNKTENIDNSNRILGLKNEYKAYQCEAINESTKHLMNVIMPLELNLFVNKYLKFSNLNSFNSLDNLFEKVTENEYILREIFKMKNSNSSGYPQKVFGFFEKLKKLIIQLKDIQMELLNFDYDI